MKYVATVLTVLFISFPTHVTVASEDCNYTWVLINTDGSKATPDQHAEKKRLEAECKRNQADTQQRGAEARKRLQNEFGVDAGGLSDSDAIMRLNAEVNNKQNAKSAAAEARADAAEKQQQDQNNALLQQQNEMLQEMGVNLQAEESDAGADSDPPDPTELKLYQKMLESGVAPHCKGKKGWAMIDCVDAATVEK